MGFVSRQLQQQGKQIGLNPEGLNRSPTDRGMGRRIWREVFGHVTTKEEGLKGPPVTEGGSYGRSVAGASGASFKRLLQAMRSMAPGGWSDDRWEQGSGRHYVGIAYIAVHRACEQMFQSEFQVFKKDPNVPEGKRPIEENDPAEGGRKVRPYDLVKLLEKPNNDDTFGVLMENYNLQLDLTGTSLTWMVPNEFGVPYELYPVPTAIAIPQPAVNPDFPDGYYRIQPVYPYGPFSSYPTPSSAVGAPIPAQWMMRVKYPHPLLRYDGFSPLTGMRLTLDVIESMERSRWYSMKRSVNPSVVLNMDEVEGMEPMREEEIERIHAEWENEFQGPENHGRIIVAPPGGKFDILGSKPVDMDYQSGWDQQTAFALGGFGMTKPAAGMVDDSSYAVLYATLKQLHLLTLKPKCVASNTPLITRDGAGYIKDFAGKEVEVWNGKRWSKVTVQRTRKMDQLIRVRFSDGSHLDCTTDHGFSAQAKWERDKGKPCRKVEAKDLCKGMNMEPFAVQWDGGMVLENAYTLGVLFGDGRIGCDGIADVQLFGEKMKLPVVGTTRSDVRWQAGCKLPFVTVSCGRGHSERMRLLRADDETAWWDLFGLNRSSILNFVAGWSDTDGSGKEGGAICLCVAGRFRADMVQLLLTKCGIRSSVTLMARAGEITNYGRRSTDMWNVNIQDCADIPCHRLDTSNGHKAERYGKYQRVKSIEYLPGLHETYCFSEPEEHKAVFNNTLTYQCDRFAAAITRKIAPFFGDDLIVEIKTQRIDDHEIKDRKLSMLVQNKAITINQLLQELDMPTTSESWGNERCGMDPQSNAQAADGPEEMAALGMNGQPGQEQEGGEMPEPPSLDGEEKDDGEIPEPPEITASRPKPGELGVGALGPRKSLNGHGKTLRNKYGHLVNGRK